MILILLLLLFVLLIFIGKKQGFKIFLGFLLNILLILLFIYFCTLGINAILLAIIVCILGSIISLFMVNGKNIKTISSILSILIVLVFMLVLIFIISRAHIQGYTSESREIIGSFSLYINYSMNDLIIAVLLICSIGSIIDTSISISSSVYEVYQNNNDLDKNELFISGINIGRDILSTTINTLLFASVCGIMTFIFWNHNESFISIINDKMFSQEIYELLICFIGSIIIIPITSYIISYNIDKNL